MEALQGVDTANIKVAKGGDRVYKEECIYSFDTPESPDGLFVSLYSLMGISKRWLDIHKRRTGESVYLHIKREKVLPNKETEDILEEKPTKLAIGIEGGFTGGIEKVEYKDHYELFVNSTIIALPCSELPSIIQESIASIIAAESATKQDQISAWEEPLIVTKHADSLLQINNGIKIPPSGWKCNKCDLTNNLWLNLTDGNILCGRRYYDGSGGNNHAVEHYEATKYPLAVKLGTITAGGADVYSYDEDSMVLDTCLAQHLSHFGIDMMLMCKTDKTMTELQIDANIKLGEWSVIQESGQELKLVYGPGYTGLQNLGNSCYMNSTIQVLFSLPEFKTRYFDMAVDTFENIQSDPTRDFNTQMCKLARGLLSGDYSQTPPTDNKENGLQKEQDGIKLNMFKTLIGTGHREFSSNRQQDAQEFLLYLLTLIDRSEFTTHSANNVVNLFRHQIEEKIQCTVSGKVKYSVKPELIVTLPVPMATASNHDEVFAWEQKKQQLKAEKKPIKPEDIVRAKVSFASCLLQYSTATDIPDFFSTALQTKSHATRMYRFKTFPDYLIVQLAKFAFDDNWVPVKFDVEVDVPEYLDLSHLRAQGIQPGELELPEENTPTQSQNVEIDENIVSQLVDMGFHIEGCKRAVYNTKNQGVEMAMNWILEHMDDPTFNSPFVIPTSNTGTTGAVNSSVSEDNIMIISSLGFTREQAIKALKATDDNVERAADWVFSHMDELQTNEEVGGAEMEQEQFRDGTGKYHLMAFISHMGTSAMSGHYVCHIRKEGRWIIYNDNKVAVSVTPPKDLAYLYFYQREKQ